MRIRKLRNEAFSSVNPGGGESKAYQIWKWLMDNGEAKRRELVEVDPTWGAVLAKYERGGLITQDDDGYYSAVEDYEFEDVEARGDWRETPSKTRASRGAASKPEAPVNSLEAKLKNYIKVKKQEVQKAIDDYENWLDYEEIKESLEDQFQYVQVAINNLAMSARKIALPVGREIEEFARTNGSIIKAIKRDPAEGTTALRDVIKGFRTELPNAIKDAKANVERELSTLRNRMSERSPKIIELENSITKVNRILNEISDINQSLTDLLPKVLEASMNKPLSEPVNPALIATKTPKGMEADVRELQADDDYQERLLNAQRELRDMVKDYRLLLDR